MTTDMADATKQLFKFRKLPSEWPIERYQVSARFSWNARDLRDLNVIPNVGWIVVRDHESWKLVDIDIRRNEPFSSELTMTYRRLDVN